MMRSRIPSATVESPIWLCHFARGICGVMAQSTTTNTRILLSRSKQVSKTAVGSGQCQIAEQRRRPRVACRVTVAACFLRQHARQELLPTPPRGFSEGDEADGNGADAGAARPSAITTTGFFATVINPTMPTCAGFETWAGLFA